MKPPGTRLVGLVKEGLVRSLGASTPRFLTLGLRTLGRTEKGPARGSVTTRVDIQLYPPSANGPRLETTPTTLQTLQRYTPGFWSILFYLDPYHPHGLVRENGGGVRPCLGSSDP